MTCTQMLLLDLDGVVVFEAEPPAVAKTELLLLHETIGAQVTALGIPIVVLTHRSRREAHQILSAAGLRDGGLAGIVAAEDLFLAGLRYAPTQMLRRGLRKDLVLPVLERRYGITRSRVAFIDDRMDNLDDLLRAGLGLALHAPSELLPDGRLLTFHLDDALSELGAWTEASPTGRLVKLPPRDLVMAPWRLTGLTTAAHGRHVFNSARRVGRAMRQSLSRHAP